MRNQSRFQFIPFKLLFVASVGLTAASCKQIDDSSKTLVTDGKIMADTDKPAIVQISADLGGGSAASCTATWVSHNTIITAAHCLWDQGRKLSNVKVSRGAGAGAKAVKVLTHPKYVDAQSVPIDNYDVGVLIFPDNSSTESIPVAQAAPQGGDPIMIVGFGKYDHSNGSSGGKKRFGNNKITDVDRQGRLNFEGSARPTTGGDDGTGESSVNSQGDSGGPMLFKERIIGVSSSVDSRLTAGGKLRGHYENLRHAPIEAWLIETTKGGANIRGLTGDDTTTTPQPEQNATIFVHVKKEAAAGTVDLELAGPKTGKKLRFAKFETLEALNKATDTDLASGGTFVESRGEKTIFGVSLGITTATFIKVQILDEADKVVAERKLKLAPI